ncbi:MAG TPA: hemolysin family protein [Ktedonobacterales bacterium]
MESGSSSGGSGSIGALSLWIAAPHPFTGYDWALAIALVVSLIVVAGSAAAETALTAMNNIRLRGLADEGDPLAQRILRIVKQPDTLPPTIVTVKIVAIISAATLTTLLAIDLSFSYAVLACALALALVTLVLCEITPRMAVNQNPEQAARLLLGPVEVIAAILKYVVIAMNLLARGILRLFGVRIHERGPSVTEESLRLMAEVGEEEGVLEEEERVMIHNVIDLSDTVAREVMVPRIDMATVEADDTIADATQTIVNGGYSRIPVYDDTLNDIIGVLYAKDLLKALANGETPRVIRDLPLRSPFFVPESKRLDDLLREMRRQRMHIAIVVDEYGAVVGLVTIEDLVEEIIGDIKDEYDIEEPIFERLSDHEFLVDAKINVEELNEEIDSDLPSEDYDTLGGFVYTQLDKIPAVGDVVTHNDLTITVLGAKGRRVTKVKIVRAASSATSAADAPSGSGVNPVEREAKRGQDTTAPERASGRAHAPERAR